MSGTQNTANRQATGFAGEKLILQLASLSELDYCREHGDAAKSLGISTSDLKRLVKNARQKITPANQSENNIFTEVTPWPEPVQGGQLLDELALLTRRFVVCDSYTSDTVALWISFTWLIDAVSVAPIANITAPQPNCGKSTLLDLLELLCYRPLKTDNVSSAALFRSIEKWHPTLLIDEVDTFLKDNESARGILNSGHKRNGSVLRVIGDDHEPRKFSTWGAKALCGIGAINKTLSSRSIRFELRRKLPHETVENLRHANRGEIATLQSKLARFAIDAHQTVSAARPLAMAGLDNRAQDNWEPLLAIADTAGEGWPERARKAASAINSLDMAQANEDVGTELLRDIRDIFQKQERQRLFTTDLLQALTENDEAPWASWNRGYPMTARQLACRLSDFGIRSDDVRIGTTVKKGYLLDKFKDAFHRYLPD